MITSHAATLAIDMNMYMILTNNYYSLSSLRSKFLVFFGSEMLHNANAIVHTLGEKDPKKDKRKISNDTQKTPLLRC